MVYRIGFLIFWLSFLIPGKHAMLAQEITWDRALQLVEHSIEKTMVEGQIPSMTIAIVKDDEVVWSNGYGYANLWARTPAVPSTVYLIGSTFKAMSTVALLRQMEAGKFELDDSVSDYLEFLRIRNEDRKEPITFRHLLTHTSGLPVDFAPLSIWDDDAPPGMTAYLSSSLRTESPPLEGVVYSNMAYTLVGYMVQDLSGKPFRQYMQKQIFEPLEMYSTSFTPSPQMSERLAIPYIVDPSSETLVPTELLRSRVWPAGLVYGTVLDQANWLIANLNEGVFKGRQIISAESLDEMHSRQFDQFKGKISGLWGSGEAGYGLTWWTDTRNGERYFAHSGSVPGYTAFLQGNKDQKLGVAMLTNGNQAHKHLIALTDDIMDLMSRLAPPEAVLSGN